MQSRYVDADVGVLEQSMRSAVSAGVFPGGVLAFALQGEVFPIIAAGALGKDNPRRVRVDTVYDLASLTKPLVMAGVCLKLLQQGVLRLEMTLSEVLGPFIPTDKQHITVAMLLGHTSGMRAWLPYYETLQLLLPSKRRQLLYKMLLDDQLENQPGTVALYSDLGYMLLTYIVEALTGGHLRDLFQDLINRPLGLDLYFDDPKIKRITNVAETEPNPVSGRMLQGVVHDDNARVAGFPLGHAGLFGNALTVLRLLEVFRLSAKTAGGFFDYDLMRLVLRKTPNSDKRLGFEAPSENGASCGTFSAQSFGHLGFTGTSFWIDPVTELTAVLLTNRVNLGRENLLIRKFRPEIHSLLASYINRLCL